MTKKKLTATIGILNTLILLKVAKVQAAIINPVTGELGQNNEGTASGNQFFTYMIRLWQTCINLGALAVIVFFIIGAFEWLTAGGDSKKVETARTRITNAVIGLIILVSSMTIIGFISKLFFGDDFDILELTFPMYRNGQAG